MVYKSHADGVYKLGSFCCIPPNPERSEHHGFPENLELSLGQAYWHHVSATIGPTMKPNSIMGDQILSSAGTGKNCALSMRFPDRSPVLDKNRVQPWVQKFYPVLGLGPGERLLWHFQTPVLYWINFSLRHQIVALTWCHNLMSVSETQFETFQKFRDFHFSLGSGGSQVLSLWKSYRKRGKFKIEFLAARQFL